MTKACADPVLARFREALDKVFGSRVERVVLFGSRARGDARPDSDYDVAVFLRDYTTLWAEKEPIADIEFDLMESTGAIIHALPYPEGAWRERTPIMHEIRREGMDL